MDYLNDIYHITLVKNEKNMQFWEDYLRNLQSLDFSVFTEKLKVAALVPVGSRLLFRGELTHTNEIITSLGADYFAKCSVKQAEILRQHRIKDAQSKLESYRKNKEQIENHISFTKNVFQDNAQEIIEVYTEEEDKAWREKHRENVRQYKQQKYKDICEESDITDEFLWMRLDELELQEELEEQLNSQQNNATERIESVKKTVKTKISQSSESNESKVTERSEADKKKVSERSESVTESFMALQYQIPQRAEKKVKFNPETEKTSDPEKDKKLYLLKKILEKQNQLEGKLVELKNKDKRQTRSASDLYSRLDEIEELEILEDEMDRLDDSILGNEDVESGSDDSTTGTHIVQRSVSFSYQNYSDTLELTFSHSNTEPCMKSYDSEKGIQKPSDIYKAHSNLFNATTSILKKSKYSSEVEKKDRKVAFQVEEENVDGSEKATINRTIVVNDVVEKVDGKKIEVSSARPTSLFKRKRQEMKS